MIASMDPLALLIGALLTARLTRLVTTDKITEPLRLRLLLHLPEDGLLAYLVHCSWCASVYVGAGVGVVGAWLGIWTWGWAAPLALSFSYVAGWLASREGE